MRKLLGAFMIAVGLIAATEAGAFQPGQCDPRCYTPGARHDGSFVCDATCSVPANNAFKGARGASCEYQVLPGGLHALPQAPNGSRVGDASTGMFLCVAGTWSQISGPSGPAGGSSSNSSEGPGSGEGSGEGK